jgi:hypothetical protein
MLLLLQLLLLLFLVELLRAGGTTRRGRRGSSTIDIKAHELSAVVHYTAEKVFAKLCAIPEARGAQPLQHLLLLLLSWPLRVRTHG